MSTHQDVYRAMAERQVLKALADRVHTWTPIFLVTDKVCPRNCSPLEESDEKKKLYDAYRAMVEDVLSDLVLKEFVQTERVETKGQRGWTTTFYRLSVAGVERLKNEDGYFVHR